MKRGKKGWAGWIPKTEDDRQKFQKLALSPNGSREWVGDGHGGGGGGQGIYDGNQEQEQVQDSGRDQDAGDDGGEMQESLPKEKAQENRKNPKTIRCHCGSPNPEERVCVIPVVKKLWVAGRASEDREEWMEEVGVHCDKCYNANLGGAGGKDLRSTTQRRQLGCLARTRSSHNHRTESF